MNYLPVSQIRILSFLVTSLFSLMVISCGGKYVGDNDEMNEAVSSRIEKALSIKDTTLGRFDDSTILTNPVWTKQLYLSVNNAPLWSDEAQMRSFTDTFVSILDSLPYYGLYKGHYHESSIRSLYQEIKQDSSFTGAAKNSEKWAMMDMLLTDAFLNVAIHLHEGRMPADSIYGSVFKRKDSLFYFDEVRLALGEGGLMRGIDRLEPGAQEYRSLKGALARFLDTADMSKTYTYLTFPYKDSVGFVNDLVIRLKEGGWLDEDVKRLDSAELAETISSVQKENDLKKDSKVGRELVDFLNRNNQEVFRTIAMNLDRMKVDFASLPDRYIMVNLPAYYLYVSDRNRRVLESKVVVGRHYTRTPLLTSQLTDIVTYPQWTIPGSIISREILPGLRRNPGYLSRRGYMLVNSNGERVSPYSINWSRYSKGIPYRVVQGSGDNNALGVLKFNFENPYSVYLHDTNQRHLFNSSNRALSHGCVRVQEYEKLALYVLSVDSAYSSRHHANEYTPADSMLNWLSRKERRTIKLKSRIPIFLRYLTAEARDGQLYIYQDIYREDQAKRSFYL